MTAPHDAKSLRAAFAERGIKKVKVGGFDIDGVLRGKYMQLEKFWSALEGGFGFCDVIFGWDIGDVLYDNAQVTGWATGYPDVRARIDPASFRVIPDEPDTAAFIVDFCDEQGGAHPACPRSLLKRIIARADDMGYRATFGAEFEFFVFREDSASLHAKRFSGLTPLTPGMFGYSWLREGQNKELCRALLEKMDAFDIPIEALHTETGPGVYEVAIRYDDALRMADKAALFKTYAKQVCSQMGLAITFMAKWNKDLPGSSGHLHQALWSQKENKNVFAAKAGAKSRGLSPIAMHYLAGQLALMPDVTALVSPTINSYKRYVPGVWAPLTASWGFENRTGAVRAIVDGPKGTRLEYRQTAADMNPYIAIATCLATGLHGIEKKLSAPPESSGDASRSDRGLKPIPRTLRAATDALSGSATAKKLLGPEFIDHYVRTRDWEVRQYEREVTEWELRRYFEAI